MDGTGIEMAEVIPGFTGQFDVEHVLAAIAPRRFLVVSGRKDKYAADAVEVVDLALPAFRSAPEALAHLRVDGGHALDPARFDSIVNWVAEVGRSQ